MVKEMLIPEYYEKFSCIGPECEDTCCAGWNITIDKKTYQKYKKVTEPSLKERLQNGLKRNRKKTSDNNYAEMILDGCGNCQMLNASGLCDVQITLGGEYLSDTCRTYPRQFNVVQGIYEKSLTPSCPEAARLILLNKDGIGFIREAYEEENLTLLTGVSNDVLFEPLRIFTIEVLQNRDYSMEDRLIIVGLVMKDLSVLSKSEQKQQIETIVSKYRNLIYNSGEKLNFNSLPSNISIQVSVITTLLHKIKDDPKVHATYREYLIDMLTGLKVEDKVECVVQNYKEGLTQYYKPFMKEKGYIIENYLVNYVFSTLYPNNARNIFEGYKLLVLHYTLIRLQILGIAKQRQGISQDEVMQFIQVYSRVIAHDNRYILGVLDALKDNGYNDLAHMLILLKS